MVDDSQQKSNQPKDNILTKPQETVFSKYVSKPQQNQLPQSKPLPSILKPVETPFTKYVTPERKTSGSGGGPVYQEQKSEQKSEPVILTPQENTFPTNKGTVQNMQPALNLGPVIPFNEVNPNTNRPYGIVSPVERPKSFLDNVSYNAESQTNLLTTQRARSNPKVINEIKLAGLGAGASFINTGKFVRSVIQAPENIVLKPIESGYYVSQRIKSGEGFPEIGQTIKYNPAYALGYATAEYTTFKAPDLFIKGFDIARTSGLKGIKTEYIIAPEYPIQIYPKITKGQTAGELLKEFKPLKIFDETKPAGFTASPNPYKIKTEAFGGSSELQGVYQAPKLSPQFLKINGEKSLFSLNPFPTLRPTALRITPEAFELVPKLSKSETVPNKFRIKELRQFFKSNSNTGKSYIPFIKTEKESIIPIGTKLVQTNRRFYFKFEGRSVPIQEFKTVISEKQVIDKYIKIEDLTSSSSLRIKSSGYINPYTVGLSGKFYSSNKANISSSNIISPISKSITSSKSYISNITKNYNGYSYKNNNSGISSKSFISGYTSTKDYLIKTPNYITPPYITPRKKFDFEGYKPIKTKMFKLSKKKAPKIKPSFTAQVFNLKGKLPKQSRFGITPFQLRKIPI